MIPPRQITGWKPADDHPSLAEVEELGLRYDGDGRIVCKRPNVAIPVTLDVSWVLPRAGSNEMLGGWPAWANVSTAYPAYRACG